MGYSFHHQLDNQLSPGQLAFGQDMIMQAKVLVDWKKGVRNKEAVANRGLVREN